MTVLRGIWISLGWLWAVAAMAQPTLEPDLNWDLRRERDGIVVYTARVPDSPHAAVLSSTIIENVRLSALVALIQDAPACAEWAPQCAASHVHELISDTEALVYTHNDLPFPVRDRDVLARVRWQQDTDSLAVSMHSQATVGILPETDDKLRLTEARATWRFTPLGDGRVEVANFAHINPGSSLPGWVTNMLLVDTPYEMLKSLVTAVQDSRYAQASISFVREPAQ